MKDRLKKFLLFIIIVALITLGVLFVLKNEKKKREEEIISKTISNITYKLINEEKLEYKIKDITYSKKEIGVRGKAKDVDRIDKLVAKIDVDKYDLNEIDHYDLEAIPVYVSDIDDKEIKNVEILVKNISASIELEEYVNTVPVYIDCVANNTNNKTFSSVTIDGKDIKDYKTTIKGKKSETDIIGLKVEIDEIPSYLNPNDNYSIKITKEDYPKIDKEFKIDFVIAEASTKKITIDSIDFLYLKDGLKAGIITDQEFFTIDLYGTEEDLSNIEDVNPKTIKAYYNLENLDEGEYKLPLKLLIEDRKVQYKMTGEDLTVRLYKE